MNTNTKSTVTAPPLDAARTYLNQLAEQPPTTSTEHLAAAAMLARHAAEAGRNPLTPDIVDTRNSLVGLADLHVKLAEMGLLLAAADASTL